MTLPGSLERPVAHIATRAAAAGASESGPALPAAPPRLPPVDASLQPAAASITAQQVLLAAMAAGLLYVGVRSFVSALIWVAFPPAVVLAALVAGPWPRWLRWRAIAAADWALRRRVTLFGSTLSVASLLLTVTGIALASSAADSMSAEQAWAENKRQGLRSKDVLLRKFRAERNFWLTASAFALWALLLRLRSMALELVAAEAAVDEARDQAAELAATAIAAAEDAQEAAARAAADSAAAAAASRGSGGGGSHQRRPATAYAVPLANPSDAGTAASGADGIDDGDNDDDGGPRKPAVAAGLVTATGVDAPPTAPHADIDDHGDGGGDHDAHIVQQAREIAAGLRRRKASDAGAAATTAATL